MGLIRSGSIGLATAAALLPVTSAVAQSPDSLDPTFSTDGIVTTGFGSGVQDVGLAMARQADGKLVLAGSTGGTGVFGSGGDFGLVRYNTDGSLDTGFDGDGKVTASFVADPGEDDEAWAVAVGSDGKIVAAGVADEGVGAGFRNFAVARFNSDGSLDTTFGGDGKVTVDFSTSDHANAVAVQTDGKIVVGGADTSSAWALARLNTDGSLDTGFDADGKVTTTVVGGGLDEVTDIELQSDGKIVAGGSAGSSISTHDFAAVRYNSDGSLDTGFDGDGKVTTAIGTGNDNANGLALQSDGKVVLAGVTWSPTTFAAVRYNTDGSLDTGFDGDGKVTTNISTTGAASEGSDVAVTASDKIVVVGRDDACDFDCDFGVVRYNTDGSLDTGFDADGKLFVPVASGSTEADWARAVLVQPDGKIAVGGYADEGTSGFDFAFAAVRLLANGDDTPPTVTVDDTDPNSPASVNDPEVKGTTEASATVRLYTTSDCSGSPAATGSGATFASPGLTVTVPSDSSTTFRATATDLAGNTSACSATSITYVEDSTAPARPTMSDTDPDSPADDNGPEVKGTAEAGSTVRIYTSALCSLGAYVAEGSAATFASPGITVSVAGDSTTTFYARAIDAAGNTSNCSLSGITYVEDSTAPAAPSITDSDPDSPANDNGPEIKGTAEAGSTVRLYTASDCSGSPVATGGAASFASPGLTVTVADNASTALYASATDAVGHVSPCSPGLTYVEDSAAPDAPAVTDTDPDSPANDNSPEVKGTVGGGSPTEVRVYKNADCSGSPAATGTPAAFTGSGITVSVTDNTSTTLSALVRDAAGNSSGCSNTLAYVEDSTAPSAPSVTDTDPNSPANDNNPEVKGSAEAGSTVKLYATSDCSGSPVATGGAAAYSSPGLTVSVADGSSTTFKATATDAAGNTSGCSSSSITYVEDSAAPDAPAVTDTDPDSPANDNSPEVKGTVGGGSPTEVRVYKSSDCSGAQAASGTVATFTGSGITVAVSGDTTTPLSARTVDAASNASDCSNTIDFVEDSTAPAAPSITDSDPDSPANDNGPEIKGTAEAATVVRLYTSSVCLGAVTAQGPAADFATPGFTVAVANDTSTTFTARAVDAAGNVSPCSSSFTYVEDSTAPSAPTVTDTDPNSPASDSAPEVKGSAAAGSTVRLYTTADCSGSPAATGSAAAYSSPGLTVSVADDSSTTFRATATDAVGNVSACSSSSITYVEDSTAPSAPSVTDTDPDSPANDNNPEVKGSAEAGTTVKLFATSDCSGSPAVTGTAASFNAAGITVPVANDTTTTFRATATDAAGNGSGCSTSPVTYVEDSTAPAAPSLTDTDPDSPANDNSPEVKGTAEAGSTVKLYTSSVCLSSVAAEGGAATFASPGLTVTVANDSSTTYYARATDAAGNVSPCSTSSITYVEDSTAPSAPSVTDTDPDSPANDNSPEVKGTAASGSTVSLYATADCTGPSAATGSAAAYSSPGLTVSVADGSSTTFRATATDAAGNVSGCSAGSVTYVEDSAAPDAPAVTDTDPDSPANDNSPEVKGTVGGGSPTEVRVYKNADCSGSPAATGTPAAFTGSGITVSVTGDAATTLTARAADQAGNQSACSGSFSYTEDSTAPSAPSVTDSDPDSPANDNSPEVKGTAEAGSTVTLFTSSTCTSSAAATGSAAAFASPGLTATVANDTTTTYWARATDAAGNTSACSSSSIAYVEDSTAPSAPTLTDTDPDSPANDNSPEVKGTAAAGSTVNVYPTAGCTGSPAATGTAAAYSSPGLTVTVADDSSTTFRATATDAAGNVSSCSAGSITYVEDSTAPAEPSFTDTDPDSPANDSSPEVKGTAEVGATVELHPTIGCTGSPAATGSSGSFASPGLTVTVADDSSTTFTATATDAAGNVSGCSSGSITYVEDSTAPGAAAITDSDPDSPADDANPELKGTAEAGSTVELYTSSDCTGSPAAAGTAAAFAAPGLTVTVASDSSTSIRATATDAAGNASGCSGAFTYVEDSTTPAAPAITDSDPDSPANDNSPELKGTAEALSTVRVYGTSDCSGTPAATGTAAAFAAPGLTVTVPNDSSTALRATATDAVGHTSACSSAFDYVEDSTAPGAPTLTDTDPDSPANDNSPAIKGTAAAGSTVRVYTTSDCSGAPAATGSAAALASPGLAAAVADDSTTTFRATATDSAGNVSGCSSSSIAYVEDSTAPPAPSLTDTDPDSPSNQNDPRVKGTAEAGTTVSLFTSDDCSGAAAATGSSASFASPGLGVTVPEDASTTFRASATDAAGNASACSSSSLTYEEDSTPPASQADSGPSGTTSDSTPTFEFSAPGSGAVTWECRLDSDAFAACSPPFTSPALADGPHAFEARAADAAGNADSSPAAWSFTVDTDADDDGVPDGSDACPTVPAPTASGCPAEPPPPPVDSDGDGSPDAEDCDDANPLIRPGAVDLPGNGVDENCDGVDARVVPTDGDDVLTGTTAGETICGLLGNDVVNGLGGNDTLWGDACGDKLRSVFGAQTGTDGNDKLYGNGGNDVLYGAGGRDTLKGGSGRDKLFGGGGNDALYGESGRDALDGGTGDDRLSGGTDAGSYRGGSGNDSVSARNRKRETVDCGSGKKDRATVDRIDRVKGCERVSRR